MGRKSFLSQILLTPIKSEIKKRIRRKTKSILGKAFAPRGKVKISVAEALEADRKRLRIRRR